MKNNKCPICKIEKSIEDYRTIELQQLNEAHQPRHYGKPMLAERLLLSMTDFVINIEKLVPKEIDQFFESWHNEKLVIIETYAKFLQQPLKLEMFLRCDENGNPLKEPEPYQRRNSYDEVSLEYDDKEVQEYKKAIEKVLFEDVEIYNNWKYNLYFLSKIEFAKYDFKTKEFVINHPFDTIESIIGLNPKLTQSALSAIFG